jgi:plasmid stabilization system protein ParE
LETGNHLGVYPTGRKGRVPGTYIKSVTDLPYILVFRNDYSTEKITILDIVHTKRDWIPGLTK